jgi:hypothetical protein
MAVQCGTADLSGRRHQRRGCAADSSRSPVMDRTRQTDRQPQFDASRADPFQRFLARLTAPKKRAMRVLDPREQLGDGGRLHALDRSGPEYHFCMTAPLLIKRTHSPRAFCSCQWIATFAGRTASRSAFMLDAAPRRETQGPLSRRSACIAAGGCRTRQPAAP